MSGRGIAPCPGTTSSGFEACCNKSQVTQNIPWNGVLQNASDSVHSLFDSTNQSIKLLTEFKVYSLHFIYKHY